MDVHHLVQMASDIGNFFAAEQPQPDEAAKAVLNHIKRYWDPRMRAQIVAHYREGGEGLAGHVREAIALLAAEAAVPKS
jgi:formate dehydrogenase subunit delta